MTKKSPILNPVKNITSIIRHDNENHTWQFSRVGGVNRVNIISGNDLKYLGQLDQKLWTALSCPVYGLEIDSRTLRLIDTDGDNRIRVPEILDAVNWIIARIKNADDLLLDKKSLLLSEIDTSTDEGKHLLASARQILYNLGMPEKTDISVKETSDFNAIFANTQFNGDGIITELCPEEEAIKTLISLIISCSEQATDRSGRPGIGESQINSFYQNCEEYNEWLKTAQDSHEKILPFGDNTAAAYNSFCEIKPKVDDYFLRCQLAEYDPSSIEVLAMLKPQYEAINPKNLASCTEEIALLPLAKMDKKMVLNLNDGINPSWKKSVETFIELVVNPLFHGKNHLTSQEWDSIKTRFTDYESWIASKKGSAVEKLGQSVVSEILEKNRKGELFSLIEKDIALRPEADNIILVDKLTRYYRDLHTLLKNFINFSDFYSPDKDAVFQAGKLYIDQRCCDLCIKVSDMPKHNSMAGSSGICLVYCNCFSKLKNETMSIVAALTDGDIDNISAGRNAIFYDREGGHWDATIYKIIDNPISIRQAFWSPYKKFSRFISNQIEKVASSKEKAVDNASASAAEKVTSHVDSSMHQKQTTPSAPLPQPFDIGKFVGIFAALSLALGAIGSIIMDILKGFFFLRWWQMPLAILGLFLAISLPSMVIAALKLRKRNLAPVLDANGWAINARITINILFGRTLTQLAELPENSKVNLIDPFAEKKNKLVPILIILGILCAAILAFWYYGFLGKWGII